MNSHRFSRPIRRRRFSAESLPVLRSVTTSKETFYPLPGKCLEKRLAIWPTSPHLNVAAGTTSSPPAVARGHERHRPIRSPISTQGHQRVCAVYSRVQVTPNALEEQPEPKPYAGTRPR